jgi:hypothetical protein
MPQITSYSHVILRGRHGLSFQQINSLFGKKVCEESFEEKKSALENVAEFIKIADALASEGISFVSLKGPILSYRIYGDATFREYCDLDLMVDLSSVRRAKDLLIGLAYEPVGYQFPDRKLGQKIVVSHVHHILFTHKTHNLRVELHWRLFQTPPVRFSKLDELVAKNLSEMTFAGRSLRILSVEMELLYLVMHGGIHSWRRLKWLVDIHEFLKKNKIDWEKFTDMAIDLRASRMISLANYVLAEYFPLGPSIPWENENIPFMKSYAIRQINEVDEPERETMAMKFSRLRFSFHCYPGLMYKFRRVRSAVIFYLYHAFRKVEHSAA